MITANLPWVESPFFNKILPARNLSDTEKQLAVDYNRNGYVVLPGFFNDQLLDRVLKDTQEKGFDPGFKFKGYRDEKRVQDLWKASAAVKELACHPDIIAIIELLYGREAIPFQTLNFRVGSEQRAHSDTIHFSALPARFMCGVWVALEDITDENGPLLYYPGSHRTPEYNFSHIINEARKTGSTDYADYENFIEALVSAAGFEKKVFHAKKGDALIWSSNIIHGGSAVKKEGATRWSQVTHYFFKDCYYYTPLLSNMVTQELFLRNGLKNIKTGQPIEQSYNGQKLNAIATEKSLYILNNNLKPVPKALRFLGKLF